MLKIGKLSLAVALGLMLSMTFLTTGVFAQGAHSDNTSALTATAVTTQALQGASKALNVSPLAVQQRNTRCFWKWYRSWRGSYRKWVCVSGYGYGRWGRGVWRGGRWYARGWRGGGWYGRGWRAGGWHGGRWHARGWRR